MAIYHANIKTISRSKGHSSIAAAAYRAGLLLSDERTGQRHDYRRRDGVVETRCMAPVGSPAWAVDPHQLWAEAERAERRKDSTVAREFEFALPHELDEDQRSSLATDVTRALVERYGFAAQASIHSPGSKGGLNHHVHILATTRRIGPRWPHRQDPRAGRRAYRSGRGGVGASPGRLERECAPRGGRH